MAKRLQKFKGKLFLDIKQNMDTNFKRIDNRLDKMDSRLTKIESLPTIKKELKEKKK